jgi:hypothetical protein
MTPPAARPIGTSIAIRLTDNKCELVAEFSTPPTEASAWAWLEVVSIGYLAGRAAV